MSHHHHPADVVDYKHDYLLPLDREEVRPAWVDADDSDWPEVMAELVAEFVCLNRLRRMFGFSLTANVVKSK